MEKEYSIDEILLAVEEIQKKNKEKDFKIISNPPPTKDFSEVPVHTLKLIEEAENN